MSLEDHPNIMTKFGRVMVLSFSENIPQGWERLTMDEGKQIESELKEIMTEWSIIAFQTGAFFGPGYGYKYEDQYNENCGEGFILQRNHH